MSDYCIDHLSLTPMTVEEFKSHIFERHEFDYDLNQICDYKCSRCEEYFITFGDAYTHQKKKGHPIEHCSLLEVGEVRHFIYKEFEKEVERCKKSRYEVQGGLEELRKQEEEVIEIAKKAKHGYKGQEIPTTSEGKIPLYEQKLVTNVITPVARSETPLETKAEVKTAEDQVRITGRKGTSGKKKVEEEEMDLEVEEEELSDEEKEKDRDEYRLSHYQKRRLPSNSPQPGTLRRSGRAVKRKNIGEAKEEGRESGRRTSRRLKEPESDGPASRLRTRARTMSRGRAGEDRDQTPIEGEKGEETTTPARNLRPRAQPATEQNSVEPSPTSEDKSRLGIINRARRATSAAIQSPSTVEKNISATPDSSQPERKRGRPKKIFAQTTDREIKPNIGPRPIKICPKIKPAEAPLPFFPKPKISEAPAPGPESVAPPTEAPQPATVLVPPLVSSSVPSPIEEASLPSVTPVDESPAEELSPTGRAPSPLPNIEPPAVESTVDSAGLSEGELQSAVTSPRPPTSRSTLTSPNRRDRDSRRSRSRHSRSKSPYRRYSRWNRTRSRERTPSNERSRDGPSRTPIALPYFHPHNQYYQSPPPGYYPLQPQFPPGAPQYPTDHTYGRQYPYQPPPQVMQRPRGTAGRPLGAQSWRPARPSFPPTGPSNGSWVTPQNNFNGRTEQVREIKREVEEVQSADRQNYRQFNPTARP